MAHLLHFVKSAVWTLQFSIFAVVASVASAVVAVAVVASAAV